MAKSTKLNNEQMQVFVYVLVIYVILFYIYYYMTKFTKQITVKSEIDYVTGMGRFIYGNNMISDMNDDVYSVSNRLLLLKFNAVENLSKLEPKQTYTVSGFGIRYPIFGLYPVITDVN